MPDKTKEATTKTKQRKPKRDLICHVSGIMIEDTKTAKESLECLDAEIEKHKALKKAIKEDYDLAEKKFIYQRGKFYNKVYKEQGKLIMKLSVNGRSLFITLVCHMDMIDNSIRINNKYISSKELITISNMSKNVLQSTLKELEQLNIIHIEGGNRNRKIYLNPKVAEDNATEQSIHKKFE